jgi:hypothetical protein
MQDYVVYHKSEVMGYEVIDVNNLAIYTNKSTNGVIGSRVWLIAGEGSPRKYKLRAMFIISAVEVSDKPAFKSKLTGKAGQFLNPMPILNAEPWFSAFVEEQGRFAFGFNRIKNTVAIERLRAILSAHSSV